MNDSTHFWHLQAQRAFSINFLRGEKEGDTERGCQEEMIELSLCSKLSCGCKWVEIVLETRVRKGCVCKFSCKCECICIFVYVWVCVNTLIKDSPKLPAEAILFSPPQFIFSPPPPSPPFLSRPSLNPLTHLTLICTFTVSLLSCHSYPKRFTLMQTVE